jgi:hypothetical protein
MSSNMTARELREYLTARDPDFQPTYRTRANRHFKTKSMLMENLDRYQTRSAAIRIQALVRSVQARRRLQKKKLAMQMNLPLDIKLQIARQI